MTDKTFNTLGSIFALGLVLSTLLIFVVKFWIVLIVNVCGYALFLILFSRERGAEKIFALSYWVLTLLSIGIMVLVMFMPEKIVGGKLSNISDIEFVKKYFGERYLIKEKTGSSWFWTNYTYTGVKTDKIMQNYHIGMGILLTLYIVQSLIYGIILSRNISYTERHYVSYLGVPLTSMGALILGNIPLRDVGWYISIIMVYISITLIVQSFIIGMDFEDNGGSDSSSYRSDTYHVYIWKD